MVTAQWAPVQQAAFRTHGKCRQNDHNNRNNSSSNYNKGHVRSNLSNFHSKYYNHHWPRSRNNNQIYAVKPFSKELVESLDQVRVVLLGKTLVETLVPTWGPVLVEAEIKEVPPEILEGTVAEALVQALLSLELEEDLAASPD